MLLNDKKVYVGHHISKKERQSKVEEQRAKFTNVFFKNLPEELSEEEFKKLIEPFGETVSVAVALDESSGSNKGFAFANFTSHESAKKAVDELNDKEVNGKKLYAGRAQKRAERDEELRRNHEERRIENESKSAGVNLYVKNMDDEWDDDRLRQEFDFAGTITSAKVMRDEKGVSRGFGFVCFSQPDEATRAVQDMNGKMIGTKPLYVSLAQKKEVRRQALESQMQQRNAQRLQYAAASGFGGPAGYVQNPMYPYPPMGPYGGPMMPVGGRGVGGGYPGAPPMMGARPARYPPSGQPGAPVPMGYMPPNAAGAYPGMPPNYPVRPAGNARPPTRPSGGSPVSAPQGLPRGGQIPARPQADAAQASQQPRLNAQALARAQPAEQKQMLGEALYPLINESNPELAGKITGMLLEMDNAELLHLLESPASLREKVDEALRVLEEWGKNDKEAEAEAEATQEAKEAPAAAEEAPKAE
jgi:polyadenylate-binding protein